MHSHPPFTAVNNINMFASDLQFLIRESNLGLLCFLLQELGAEKSKIVSLEARLKAEQSTRVQEVNALQTRMQTADQDHLKHVQQLNQKVLFV